MEIQPIVIGTAGHIDHGKSTLVRALTGIDPDRLKEEKERGLTIDLGFAPLELPDGRLVGIVDVPGHERFIRNMVAGASGIDLVCLVVAGDDGVMPQTREHLLIMELLGVRHGLVALTKIDMVEEDLVDLAEEDVREAVQGTFLEGAEIMRVSAPTGAGLEELKQALFRHAAATEPRSAEGVFRMPVQRVFSKRGFGTVVTGIPLSGEAHVGDFLEVLPGNIRGKVRGLNAYREETPRIRAGHSSAINFSDVDQGAVQRGFVVATPGYFTPQRMVAARIQAIPGIGGPLTNRMHVRIHAGTADPHGELILLDREEIPPGESGIAQLRLSEPIVCAPGDRFVLRLMSPAMTLGGGTILEESRYRLKRFRSFVLDELSHQEESLASPSALLESLLSRYGEELVATDELAKSLKCPRDETRRLLEGLAEETRVHSPKQDRWIHADRLQSALKKLRDTLEAFFREESHRSVVDVLELRRRTSFEPSFLSILLAEEESRGVLERLAGGKIRPSGREVELEPAVRELAEKVESRYVSGRFQPPSLEELEQAANAGSKEIDRVVELLVDAGRLEHLGSGLYLSRPVLDEARQAITANCQKNGKLVIPELRDRLVTSRKYLIPILEYFDAVGLTNRQGGHRVLRQR
jgi:selenocysteine-specific elongation factor